MITKDFLSHFFQHLKHYQGIISGCVFLIIYVAEHLFPERKKIIDHKHDLFNLLIGAFDVVLIFFTGIIFNKFINWAEANHIGLMNQFALNELIKIVVEFILIDLFMYWWHRANHELPFLWFFHKFHHKDEKMSTSTVLRFHPGELIMSFLVKTVIFVLLGIHSWIIIFYGIILFVVITFHHSNLFISDKVDFFLRNFIASPKMHRIHHSKIKSETNSNYGSVFPYWDKIFRTYIKTPSKPVEFGID